MVAWHGPLRCAGGECERVLLDALAEAEAGLERAPAAHSGETARLLVEEV